MQKENQDAGASRVRHVPIKIESREGNHREWQNNQQPQHQQFFDPHNHPQQHLRHQYDNNYPQEDSRHPGYGAQRDDSRMGSQNATSSININYKPQPPPRHPSPTSTQQDHFNPKRTPSPTDEHVEDRKSRSWLRGKNKKDRSRERFNSAHNTSNSDKLVSSPEPIPLPPPQQQHQPQQQEQKQQQQHQHQHQQETHDFSSATQQTPQEGQTSASPGQQTGSKALNSDKIPSSPQSTINSVKLDITNLLQGIDKFDGISNKSKDYRYLDEMLTRCMLNLDNVECGTSSELRKQRKAGIKFVDQATDILQRKLQVNIDIHTLNQNMTSSK